MGYLFPGAKKTFAADVLNPDGKVVQQPSTHMIKQDFAKAFDIKFKDKDGKDKYVSQLVMGLLCQGFLQALSVCTEMIRA